MQLQCGAATLDMSTSQVMGVLNVTPDSFSDGGRYTSVESALLHAKRMVSEGAALIDVGGESTRPGAAAVSLQQELDRVCPVVEKIISEIDVVVSVDTSTPELMAEAIRLGCGMVNDVRAFSRAGAIEAVKNSKVALCVMHMQGEPGSMQRAPDYVSVVEEIVSYLKARVSSLVDAGVSWQQLVLDPGFGFGKTLEHNLKLLAGLDQLVLEGFPVLAGLSRKSMIGAVLENDVDERLYGSISAAVIARMKGANILRVHDVKETVEALKMVDAVTKI